MRTFKNKISKITKQCIDCGLVQDNCICEDAVNIESAVEFWLLTHENELRRTNNTGRLIENAISSSKVFVWNRTIEPIELIELIDSDDYNVFLVMAADRESEIIRARDYSSTNKKTAFLILDGTWKEVRKIIKKSYYLDKLPIISLETNRKTIYNLRRNSDDNHLCTVEVGVALLNLIGENKNANLLNEYFAIFLKKYNEGRYNHNEVKND